MALTPTCDRCSAQHVQLVPVLGRDVCNQCVVETRLFLSTPPRRCRSVTPAEQAMHVCAVAGRVVACELALANGEPRRRVYYRLMGMAKAGKLVHLGRGVFAAPAAIAEAAE